MMLTVVAGEDEVGAGAPVETLSSKQQLRCQERAPNDPEDS